MKIKALIFPLLKNQIFEVINIVSTNTSMLEMIDKSIMYFSCLRLLPLILIN